METGGCVHCGERGTLHAQSLCDRIEKLERIVSVFLEERKKAVQVGIVGCRHFTDYDTFCAHMDEWAVDKLDDGHRIASFVSGGARGADSLAERYAKEKGVPIVVHRPDWAKAGKAAGVLRNTDIVRDSDYVVAFPSKRSVGTRDTVRKAKKARKNVTVYEI